MSIKVSVLSHGVRSRPWWCSQNHAPKELCRSRVGLLGVFVKMPGFQLCGLSFVWWLNCHGLQLDLIIISTNGLITSFRWIWTVWIVSVVLFFWYRFFYTFLRSRVTSPVWKLCNTLVIPLRNDFCSILVEREVIRRISKRVVEYIEDIDQLFWMSAKKIDLTLAYLISPRRSLPVFLRSFDGHSRKKNNYTYLTYPFERLYDSKNRPNLRWERHKPPLLVDFVTVIFWYLFLFRTSRPCLNRDE